MASRTMIPLHGNFELRPLGVTMGNAVSVTHVWSIHTKSQPVGRRQPMTSLPARPQYKGRWENTSSTSSSEACVRNMAHSLADAVYRSPLLLYFTFSHLADAFIQSDLQIIKSN